MATSEVVLSLMVCRTAYNQTILHPILWVCTYCVRLYGGLVTKCFNPFHVITFSTDIVLNVITDMSNERKIEFRI